MAEETTRYIFELSGKTTGIDELKKEEASLSAAMKHLGYDTLRVNKILDMQQTAFLKNDKQMKNVITVWRSADNKIYKTIRTLEKSEKGWRNVNKTIRNTEITLKKVKQATPMIHQFGEALRRVAIVVPVWQAARAVMQLVFGTLRDGMEDWRNFSKEMVLVKPVIHDTVNSIGTDIAILEHNILNLSLKTGEARTNIAKAFYEFGTLGIDFQKSWAGATAAMNISLALGGDLNKTARTLAMTYKILGDSLEKGLVPMNQMQLLGAKLFKVWKTNAFKIDEFSSSLTQFISTAKTANISLNDTIALLSAISTAGILGSRGGRQLRQGITKFIKNIDEVGASMGILREEGETTISMFLKVISAFKQLTKAGVDLDKQVRIQSKLSKIFGGVRSVNAIKALISVQKTLSENVEIMNTKYKDSNELLQAYKEQIESATDSLDRQLAVNKNLRTQMGRMFIEGIIGGKDFKDTLKKINGMMKDGVYWAKAIGDSLSSFFGITDAIKFGIDNTMKSIDKFSEKLQKGLRAELSVKELKDLIRNLGSYETASGMKISSKTIKLLKENLKKLEKDPNFRVKIPVNIAEKELKSRVERAKEEAKRLKKEFEANKELHPTLYFLDTPTIASIRKLKEQLEIIRMTKEGLSKVGSSFANLVSDVGEYVTKFNESNVVLQDHTKAIKLSDLLTKVLKEDWEGVIKLVGKDVIKQKDVIKLQKDLNKIATTSLQQQESVSKLLINHELALLKIKGATNLEILKATQALNEMAGINQDTISKLKTQLSIEQEITKEKTHRNTLSSRSLKLFEIAKKYGKEYAVNISKYLAGKTSWEQFKRSGQKTLKIFKKEFKNVFTNEEAKRYFEKNKDILIPERVATKDLEERMRKLGTKLPKPSAITQKIKLEATVPEVKINVSFEEFDIKRKILDAIDNALTDPTAMITQRIKNIIEQY